MKALRTAGNCLAVCLFLLLPVKPNSMSDFFVGHPAPDFNLKDLDGHDVQLSSLKGHIVLVDFWASWCGPCRMEMPMLQHISKQLEKKGVIVLGINANEPEDIVRRFVTKNKIAYPILLPGDTQIVQTYGAYGLPTVAVIDKDGIIAAYRVGENPGTEETLRDDIHVVSSSKYVAPKPKIVQLAQVPAPSTQAGSIPPGPDPNWQPKTADEFIARGYARLRVHKYPQALADAEDALKLRPGWVTARFLHGRAAYDQRDYATCIQDMENVIRQAPDWGDAYRYRGLALSYSGQHERALPDYEKAIELNPHAAPAYNALGWACEELGQYDKAKENLDKAIEIEPDFMLARENRAKLFDKQRDLNAEVDELSIILNLQPANQWAKNTKEAVLQKQHSPAASVQPVAEH